KLKTLDGVERTLFEDDLVIADAEKPIALAGVIGGEDTKVTDTTRNILIEAAWFDTATVRRTSRRHGLHTDASHRFERGADFNATPLAARRVAQLIQQQSAPSGTGSQLDQDTAASGTGSQPVLHPPDHSTRGSGCIIASGLLDVIAHPLQIPPIELRLSQVRRILGKEIGGPEIKRILTRLGFVLRPLTDSNFEVAVPTWRLDISREIDLIEEIARVHGFNQFENHLPAFSGAVVELPTAQQENQLRHTLLALGYNEALSNTFSSREDAQRFTPQAKPVELENPLSEERAVMRTSLVPGMLDMLAHNLNRDQNSIRLFEMGNVFRAEGDQVVQSAAACLAFTGPQAGQSSALKAAKNSDSDANLWPIGAFFQLKGDVEALLATYSGTAVYEKKSPEFLASGNAAQISLNHTVIGSIGELSPAAYGTRKFKQPIYLAELYLDRLYPQPLRQARYTPLSRYPAVERDFSFLIPEQLQWNQLHNAILSLAIAELKSFEIIDVFPLKSTQNGNYSALFRGILQSNTRTLTDQEIAHITTQIITTLTTMGATLRT
ncbi:MAG: phenylalanine--tRNA ligase subunit beta, partial [Acidobacteriaceae bacterium]